MISNKTSITNLTEEESDHYFSELSFELDKYQTQPENFNSNYDLDNQENMMLLRFFKISA